MYILPDGINDSPSIASLQLCSASLTKDTRTGEDGHFHFFYFHILVIFYIS